MCDKMLPYMSNSELNLLVMSCQQFVDVSVNESISQREVTLLTAKAGVIHGEHNILHSHSEKN